MVGTRKIRSWKALALFAAILALVLLLLPQAHHAAVVFLLVPIFLFGLLDTLAPQHATALTITLPHWPATRLTLFQRPPPTQA